MATFRCWLCTSWQALRRPVSRFSSLSAARFAILLFAVGVLSTLPAAAQMNPIQQENSLPGTPNWNGFAADLNQTTISGFGSKISLNHGDSIDFYVTTTAPSYTIDVYRAGYYQGIGARLVQSLGSFPGKLQAIPKPNPVTGMISCLSWTKATTLQVPSTWVTGIYLAKLTSSTGFSSFIFFVVRNDGGTEDLVFQASVTTYQAYNTYGGTSLYNNLTDMSVYPYPHATKVSFDRPFNPGDSNGAGHYLFYEHYFVYWLESQGYNVAYSTDVDTDLAPTPLTNHKGFMSVGHDEYWSMGMRTNLQNAINAGVNAAFFSGNSMYWQIRFEPNTAGLPDRVQVGYKDFATLSPPPGPDPEYGVNNSIVTTNWRDPTVNMPENGIIGVMYEQQTDNSYAYVVQNAESWIYDNTGFVNGSSVPGIVGYEYDKVWNNGFSPPGLTVLSSSPVNGCCGGFASDANSTMYTAPSGARVFGAGTIQWSWGLANLQGNHFANAGIQQTTANILNNFILGPTPNAGLSATSLNFNGGVIGTSAVQSVTLTSNGTATLDLSSIAVTGANAGDFTQTNNCPAVMGINVSCTISVTFAPTGVGNRSASLTITDNAGNSPQNIALSGIGQATAAPIVKFNPTSLTFGYQDVGTTSAPQTVTVTNIGTAALSFSSIATTGADPADFIPTNNCPSGANTLAVNASCTISVTFSPTLSNTRSASVTVTDNAADSPESIAVSGSAITPTIYFKDGFETGDFSQWTLGSSDSTGQRTVQTAVFNSGTYAASFTNTTGQYAYIYTALPSGPQNQTFTRFYFRLSNSGNGTMLAAARNANGGNTWEVDYDGAHQALDFYFWNSSGGTYSFSTLNQAIAANTWYCLEIQDTQTSTGQGQAWLNGTSIGSVSADLSNANPYVRLMLFSSAVGTFYFDDVVVANVYNGPLVPEPALRLNPLSLNFGNQSINTTSGPLTITLLNRGTATLTLNIAGFNISGANASDFAVDAGECPFTLAVSASCTLTVTFTPGALGSRSAALVIVDNDPTSPQSVPLSGAGINPGPAITLSPASLTFPNQVLNTNSATQTITLTSSGTVPLSITGISVTGTNPGDFTESDNCPTGGNTLAVSAFCTISITFTPTANGTRSANLSVADNVAGSPQTLPLSGTGFTAVVYFTDGFETGDFSQWTLGSSDSTGQRTVQTAVVNSGTYAASFTNTTGQYAYIYTALPSGPQNQTFTRFYFRLTNSGNGTMLAVARNANGGNTWEVDYNGPHQGLDFYFWNSSGGTYSFSTLNQAIAANTWYCLEIQDTQTSTGQGQAWLNGTSIGSVSADLSNANPYARLMLFTSAVGTFYFDDVAVGNVYNGPVLPSQPTTATVTADVNPAGYGQTVTLSATVQASHGTPTGSVAFMDGTSTLGTVVLTSGSAQLPVSTLGAGAHSITAKYFGDTNYQASTSAALTETVNPLATTTTLASSLNPATAAQPITLTANVQAGTGISVTGTVTFMDGSTTLGTATLTSNTAQFTTSTLSGGAHSLTAVYPTGGNFSGSTSAVLTETVNQIGTTTSVASSLNPAQFAQLVTFTATIQAGTGNSASGTVAFLDGASTLGTATVNNNTAQFSTSSLTLGSHTITAVYGGATNFAGSTSPVLTQTVNQITTTITVASSANPSAAGQSVTFTATIQAGTGNSATGTVTFLDGSTTLGTATVSNNSAQFSTSNLAPGGHSITATYGGATNFTGSTSPTLAQTVNVYSSTTALTSSLNPANYSQTVTLSATVQSTAGTPTGSVTFLDGASALGTVALTAGVAQLSVSNLIAGSHSITAQYSGDANFGASTSAALTETVNPMGTTTSLASGLNPAQFGQSVTFTATIQPGAGNSATGSISFLDGSTTLGTVPVSSNAAQFSTTTLALGSHTVTAVYGGSANFSGSTSASVAQTINQVTTSITLASSLNPAPALQSVTFTATMQTGTGSSATGTVSFLDGSTTLGTGTLNNNTAQFSTSSLAPGSHSITAAYAGSTNFAGSTSNLVTQTVNILTTTTSLASSANPALAQQAVTFTATIQPGTGNSAVGTVNFMDGSTSLGTVTVASNSAQLTVSTLAVGSHSITAAFSGSTNFGPSTSSALTETVNQSGTTTTLVSNLNPATYGQSVPFVATVHPTSGGAATGTVTFFDGGASLGTAAVSSNVAQFTATGLLGGTHSITATYNGDANNAASTSSAITQTVNTASSSISVAASANPATYGQSVTLTATVVPSVSGALATGTVTFLNGSTSLGTGTLSSNVAQLNVTTLTAGSHSITASYAGDRNFAGSTSSAITETVNPAATSTVLTSSANPSISKHSVTFTATVSSSVAGTQAGSVSFYLDGSNTAAATVTLSGSTAKYSNSSLSAGSHTIKAVFTSTNANFAGSTSSTLTQVISDFGIAVSPSSLTVTRGTSGTYTLTISALDEFSGAVSLTCSVSGNKTGITCAISPTSVTLAGSGSVQATVTVTVTAAASTGARTVTLTGTNGALSHNVTASLTIN